MKKVLIALIVYSFFILNAFGQLGDQNPTGFKKENVFVGGGLNFGVATGYFAIGGIPEIGYSFNKWLDAGLLLNVNYTSQKSLLGDNTPIAKYTSFNTGAGSFFRLYPIPNFFLQGQLEQNFISFKYTDYYTNITSKTNVSATSFLAGIGYGNRQVGQSNFYTVIMIDLLNDRNSPYKLYSPGAVNSTLIPVIRGGFDIYLRPKKRKLG